jgi:hypothetical protein
VKGDALREACLDMTKARRCIPYRRAGSQTIDIEDLLSSNQHAPKRKSVRFISRAS